MKNLNLNELILINGGQECHPTVSSDSSVQAGYGLGWHIGHALGNTLEQIGDMLDAVNPFSWFD